MMTKTVFVFLIYINVFLIYINVYPLRPILRGTPLFVDIQGLEYMNDDPGAVDVLYAKIQPSPEADK